ncbi:Rec8p SCDLUD_000834 [Saccharomycodes ludwigii]|uniref:Rec8p n=1 Tax=Saccharomycodes ludwigii TaxID=36035 RepID=UPI001E8359DF|nr:hypothetical protein SCDLUD_000834 [Saccharomycodes ludwigii]KAH3903215.1 hypothetical protein SCDLUD_000834 [Saccharomycodes ludwigii]
MTNRPLTTLWLLSTLGGVNINSNKTSGTSSANNNTLNLINSLPRNVQKKDILQISIPETCESILKQELDDSSLKYISNLMFGLTICYNKKNVFLLNDLLNLRAQLKKAIMMEPTTRINKQMNSNNSSSTINMALFDGEFEYKNIFEYQKAQSLILTKNKNGNSNHFLQDDLFFDIQEVGNTSNKFIQQLLNKNDPAHPMNVKENDKNSNIQIRQYDLGLELGAGSDNFGKLTEYSYNSVDLPTNTNNSYEETDDLVGLENDIDFDLDILSQKSDGSNYIDLIDVGSRGTSILSRKRSFSDVSISLNYNATDIKEESPFEGNGIEQNAKVGGPNSDGVDQEVSLSDELSVNDNSNSGNKSEMEAEENVDAKQNSTGTATTTAAATTTTTNINSIKGCNYKKIKLDVIVSLKNDDLRFNNSNYIDRMSKNIHRKRNKKLATFNNIQELLDGDSSSNFIINKNIMDVLFSIGNDGKLPKIMGNKDNALDVKRYNEGNDHILPSSPRSMVSEEEYGRRLSIYDEDNNNDVLRNSISGNNNNGGIKELEEIDELSSFDGYFSSNLQPHVNKNSGNDVLDIDLQIRSSSISKPNSAMHNKNADYYENSSDLFSEIQQKKQPSISFVNRESMKLYDLVKASIDVSSTRMNITTMDKVVDLLITSDNGNASTKKQKTIDKNTGGKKESKALISNTFYSLLQLASRDLVTLETKGSNNENGLADSLSKVDDIVITIK